MAAQPFYLFGKTDDERIEVFFLRHLLAVALIGGTIVLIFDFIYKDLSSHDVYVDMVIIVAVSAAMGLMRVSLQYAAYCATMLPLVAMTYEAVHSPKEAPVAVAIMLAAGFLISVLLKGKFMRVAHAFSLGCILFLGVIITQRVGAYGYHSVGEAITFIATTIAIYTLICYAASVLKNRYDDIMGELTTANLHLQEQNRAIAAQHQALIIQKQALDTLYAALEEKVAQRTQEANEQRDKIYTYANDNAHKVRASVARILGLLIIAKQDNTLPQEVLFELIFAETHQLEQITQDITKTLEGDISNLYQDFWLR